MASDGDPRSTDRGAATDPSTPAPPSARPGEAPTHHVSRPQVLKPLLILILRALARTALMLWMVATVTFLMIRALPGNPVDVWVQELQNSGLSGDQAREKATQLLKIDVDEPLWNQYLDYMWNLAHGDLGNSVILSPGTPVTELLGGRLLWTLFSLSIALVVGFVLGLYLGSVAAYRRGTFLDRCISNISALMSSVPAVIVGILLVFLVGVVWDLVPLQDLKGAHSPEVRPGLNIDFIISAIGHAIAPGFVYVLVSFGGWALLMRSNALGVLSDDYVSQARARGLSERTIRVSFVQRNARLPLITAFAINMGFIVSGSVLVERIFVYPGVGQLLATALARRDYTVMQGVVIATTVTVLLTTALADALYGWLDPRTRIEQNK